MVLVLALVDLVVGAGLLVAGDLGVASVAVAFGLWMLGLSRSADDW